MENEQFKTRKNWTDEEVAQIVGGYRLTDGQQQEYAEKIGVSKNALSYCVQKARMLDLRARFPDYFGDATPHATAEALQQENAVLTARLTELGASFVALQDELRNTKRKLEKAVNMILDD